MGKSTSRSPPFSIREVQVQVHLLVRPATTLEEGGLMMLAIAKNNTTRFLSNQHSSCKQEIKSGYEMNYVR